MPPDYFWDFMEDGNFSQFVEADRAQRAFLKAVQEENACEVTGEPCREDKKCGCWLEMDELIRKEIN